MIKDHNAAKENSGTPVRMDTGSRAILIVIVLRDALNRNASFRAFECDPEVQPHHMN